MNKILPFIGLGALLASCGVSGDLRTSVYGVSAETQYRTGSLTGPSVACDKLFNNDNENRSELPSETVVKASFSSTGNLGSAQVRLVGEESGKDNGFATTFSGSNLQGDATRYTVRFEANSNDGKVLPQSVGALGITVNPAQTTVKIVKPNIRVGINGGFRVEVRGTSDQGASTGAVVNATAIPVYSDCTLVQDSGTTF
jgi:hypothetical protein